MCSLTWSVLPMSIVFIDPRRRRELSGGSRGDVGLPSRWTRFSNSGNFVRLHQRWNRKVSTWTVYGESESLSADMWFIISGSGGRLMHLHYIINLCRFTPISPSFQEQIFYFFTIVECRWVFLIQSIWSTWYNRIHYRQNHPIEVAVYIN